jgi:hypothetical protein
VLSHRPYLIAMGICLLLIASAWTWVRLLSVTAAVVMSVLAMLLPPLAVILADAGREERRDLGPPP